MKQVLVCLCGGYGTRFQTVSSAPKILAPVFSEKVPAIMLIDRWAEASGFVKVFYIAGYNGQMVREFVQETSMKVSSEVLLEEVPGGTAAAIDSFLNAFPDEFFVCNGDTLFSEPLNQRILPAGNTLYGCIKPDTSRYGTVMTSDGMVSGFAEKEEKGGSGVVSVGIARLCQDDLKGLNGSSLERDIYPLLATAGLLKFEEYSGQFIDYGTEESYAGAARQSVHDFMSFFSQPEH